MAKFRMKVKLQGFELEIDGEREDVPLMASNLGEQFAGLIAPAANIAAGQQSERRLVANEATAGQEEGATAAPQKRQRKRRTAPAAGNGSARSGGVEPLSWTHNPEKWGNPLQTWTTAEKSIWLLYVIEHEVGKTAVSGSAIASTFNQHFRQAKQVHPPNVTRDLGRAKTGANSLVGEDTTKSPSEWFLTSEGKKKAIALVEAALGKPDAGQAS